MTNQNQELLFIFAGITYAGAMLLTLAVLAGIRRLTTPKPPKQHIPTPGRYTRDWENLEERWNK